MAPPAADRPALSVLVFRLWEPSRERAELAFRLALICALTALATVYYDTPEPALTVYLVFFLNRPDRATSVILNIALVVLVTILLLLVLVLAIRVVDAPAWRVATMALVSMGFLYLASASKLRPVAPILAMVAAYALDLLGFVPLGELATRGLLYAWLFVSIPAAISLVVNLLIAPAPRRLAERALAANLRAASERLVQPASAPDAEFVRRRDTGAQAPLGWLRLAKIEHGTSVETLARLEAAARATPILLYLVDELAQEPSVPAAWRAEAAARLCEMAQAFDQRGYPEDIAPPPALTANPGGERLMRAFERTLTHFTDLTTAPPAEPGKAGFFLPDAVSNPQHLRYALKTTGAAMVCYFLYVLLDWPGIHTCLITCYIVALGTAAETTEKLSLRILGCLAGAAVGTASLVWIVPTIASGWAFVALVFAGALVGGWIAAGSPRIAYGGLQFAFAFFLCVIQGAGPAFDLTIARDRVIGIIIGNAVTYLVFTRLWPVSIVDRVEQGLASMLTQFNRVARSPIDQKRTAAATLQTAVSALGDDLDLARYEPRPLRPPPQWETARRTAAQALSRLTAPIVLDDDPAFWTSVGDRLGRLSDAPGAASVDRPSAPPGLGNLLQVRALTQIQSLEEALDPGA
ncbi:MAG: FUSC family protein [Caulobacter sp.]|nr:FUSC family protein [Caulobacter sp.]